MGDFNSNALYLRKGCLVFYNWKLYSSPNCTRHTGKEVPTILLQSQTGSVSPLDLNRLLFLLFLAADCLKSYHFRGAFF